MPSAGDRIKFIRKQNQLSQKDFADILQISQTHVSKIESGKDKASDKILRIISVEFGINFEWLKEGTGPIKAPEGNFAPQKVLINLKHFLETSSEFEIDLCTILLEQIPSLFGCAKKNSYRDNILLTISELFDNIINMNRCLDEEVSSINLKEDLKDKIYGISWIREMYQTKINDNIDKLYNLYMGGG